jgi:acyl carrier protein phosphodiesterase
MNYLAHLYLARHDDDAMLAALLSDFVGSSQLEAWPMAQQREIRLHWQVDSYTDGHAAVKALRELFPDGRRRYAGIALDVYFDHLLARDWARFHPEPLDDFSSRVYGLLRAQAERLPERLRRLAPLMISGDWLGSYRQRDSVDLAVRRIATRLSRNGDRLVACLPLLRANEPAVQAGFAAFFPELQQFVERQRREASLPAASSPRR